MPPSSQAPSEIRASAAGSGRPGAAHARRKPVPHYLSKTTLHKDRLFRIMYVLSVLVNIAYFALRLVYICTGRVKVAAPEDASQSELDAAEKQNDSALTYSIIVLVAELGGFVLVHAGQQMFTKQRTQFAKMTDENVAKMDEVCACSFAANLKIALQPVQTMMLTWPSTPRAWPLSLHSMRLAHVCGDAHSI